MLDNFRSSSGMNTLRTRQQHGIPKHGHRHNQRLSSCLAVFQLAAMNYPRTVSRLVFLFALWMLPAVVAQFNFFDMFGQGHQAQQNRGSGASQWAAQADSSTPHLIPMSTSRSLLTYSLSKSLVTRICAPIPSCAFVIRRTVRVRAPRT